MKLPFVVVLVLIPLPSLAQTNNIDNSSGQLVETQPAEDAGAGVASLERIAQLREERRDITRQIRGELQKLPASERPLRVNRQLRPGGKVRSPLPLRPLRPTRYHARLHRQPFNFHRR